jgi:branched-chain amino acid transport system substrate-binding protein
MIRNRFRRTATVLAASAVALGLSSVGFAVGAANASTPVPGVTAGNVTIGATVPLSGIASGYAEVSAAANAVFKWQNTHGKVHGRTITYTRLDDCYDTPGFGCTQSPSTTTLTQTEVLVQSDHVFATVGSLGTAAQDSVRSYLQAAHTPQLFVNSGSSDWNNPTVYPGLFGFQASYKVEGKIFAQYVTTHYKNDKVGFFGQNDDFGANGYVGLTEGPDALTIAAKDKVLYNVADAVLPTTTDISGGVTQMKSDGVQVVVLDSIPPVTNKILSSAHNQGFKPVFIISSVGSDPTSVGNTTENNATSFDSLPATNDTKNVWNVFIRKVLLADKTDFPHFTATTPLDGNMGYGVAFGVAFIEALNTAGASPTQAGLEAAMISTKYATPSITPLSYSKTNHQGLQCGVISTIESTGSAKYILTPSHVVSCTTDAAGGKVTLGKYTISAIPKFL